MEDESVEDCSVEVLQIPDSVDDDLLWLYLLREQEALRRRERHFFDENQGHGSSVAARVVQKDTHKLSNGQLIVRKKPPKDDGKLVLRGLPPNISHEVLELYIENLTGIESDDYSLHLSPGKDLVLIHLHQSAAEDFEKMRSRVSKRTLDGAQLTLEQVECTDSIMVGNLTTNLTEDLLMLYFESSRSGGGDVLAVRKISQHLAKVTFKNVQSVDRVLQKSHKLEEVDLIVKPYYSFLHSEEEVSQTSLQNRTGQDVDDQVSTVSPLNDTHTDLITAASSSSSSSLSQKAVALKPDFQVSPEPDKNTSQVPPPEQQPFISHVSIPDPIKRKLVTLCHIPEKLGKSHPDYQIRVTQNGVEVAAPAQDAAERLKSELLEFLSGVSQLHLPLSPLKAEFLQRQDIRDRLISKLKDQELLCTFTLMDGVLILSAASMQAANQAHELIQGTVSDFVLRVEPEYEYIIYSEEWRTFLQSQNVCSTETSPQGDAVSVVTLKDAEQEVKKNIVRFLSTHIDKEEILSMQPAMLTYIQLHHQQLLMDMAQVVILPLDTADGLSIQGNPTTVGMAMEVLSSVVNSTFTKIITVNQPGIARFLLHDDEGRSILQEMTIKFQVYINLERVHWEPVEEPDVFDLAWKMMSSQNFARSCSALDSANQTSEVPASPAKHTSDRIEEAKKILSLLEDDHTAVMAEEEEYMDLYSDHLSLKQKETQESNKAEIHPEDLVSLDEDAHLSLAIQMSMEVSQNPGLLAEEELQKVLQLSKVQATSLDESQEPGKAAAMSLQDIINLANMAQIEVFACYSHDLVRVDIALGKKVGQRQHEEKLLHTSFRKLSGFQRLCLDLIKRKHAVEIQLQGTTATISGFKDYVTGALPELNELLSRVEASATDGEILTTVQPRALGPDVVLARSHGVHRKRLEDETGQTRHPVGQPTPHYRLHTKMQEFSVSTGRSTAISRKLISSIKVFDEYSLLSDVPDTVRLEEQSEEYKQVSAEFFSSHTDQHKIQIIQVEKLLNRLLFSQYQLKKADMEQKVRGEVERTLYHGTSEISVKEICIHGFNRSFCGKNATAFGQGVYFAVKSSYSLSDTYSPPNADGHKFIFMARVLTGDFTTGRHEMRAAPLRTGSDIPERYHSVVDNKSMPGLFVIFNDTQAYPQYLITCCRIPH
ncbi:Poly [ADP-ribose] polymerase 10 [Bagarius yarrelli]|uniref:Poly [ADP-ribose] polymerase n=1 Tax=Bagarius yarrelli TaxID=175774 RepID=A0A556VBH9_BAGYA|nr:Poly [ADP-ribose] polymerase 10 [Bagarius yarrelli]